MDSFQGNVEIKEPILLKERWIISVLLSWLGLSNALLLMWYANIADVVSNFYETSLFNINMLSVVYPLIAVVLGFPTIWFINKVGLGIAFICCGWLNTASALFRLFSTFTFIDLTARFPLIMVAQILGGIAQSLAMFSPCKMTSVWFPHNQRVIGNTIAAIGAIVGVLLGSLLPPFLYNSGLQLVYHSIIMLVVSMIGAISAMFVLRCPSPKKKTKHKLIKDGLLLEIKMSFRNISFIVLTIVFGIAIGLFTAISALMQQILCPYGYSNSFAGVCGALLIGCGIVTSFITGYIADKTKNLTGIIRACMTLATLGVVVFTILTNFSKLEIPIAISVSWIGACGVGLYSVALELGAIITTPVSEVASNGILVIVGQLFSIIFIFVAQFVTVPYVIPIASNCSATDINQSFWIANVLFSVFASVSSVVILVLFSNKYFEIFRGPKIATTDSSSDLKKYESAQLQL